MKKLNILIIAHFFPPHKGGVETAAYNTAKYLVKFSHNVVVVTSKLKENLNDYYIAEGIHIYQFKTYAIPEIKKLSQISSWGWMPKAIFKMKQIVKKHEIDLIHIQGHFFPISVIVYFQNLFIFKKPIFFTMQGRLDEGFARKLEDIYDYIFTKPFFQKAEKIICVSKSLKERYIRFKIDKNKLMVIPNGVNCEQFQKKPFSDEINKIFNNDTSKRIIFVGRLEKQKGIEFLIRAIPLVLNQFENMHLYIFGNGHLELFLKKLVKELKIESSVTFKNMVPLEKMPEVYSGVDILCLPSLHEGFPLTIAEALSIGLIIIASNIEGIPEAIKENINGFLCEPGNIYHLKEKLIKALTLPEEKIREIKNNNINLAKKRYDWKNIVKEIEDLYKNVLYISPKPLYFCTNEINNKNF